MGWFPQSVRELWYAVLNPSPFVVLWLPRIFRTIGGNPCALDLAIGKGRHAIHLARAGFRVFGVDQDYDSVWEARNRLNIEGFESSLWVENLERFSFSGRGFDLVICSRYLQRTLWPTIKQLVVPGGFLMYETFTVKQLRYDCGPRSSEHLLTSGRELKDVFNEWEHWGFEEKIYPTAEASLVARKPFVNC
tara:strand:- start:1372 stop:1944 length:573 start_codon:yes stop_codon:yes gene_type:complete